jgi:L-threonylcarbamoyladenylate synthase
MSDEVQARIVPINEKTCSQARAIVQRGGLIVVPTDTVYGVACDPTNDAAIDAIFRAKHRSRAKTLQILLPNLSVLPQLGLHLPPVLSVLSQALLPGGFSPIAIADSSSPLATLRTVEQDGVVSYTQAIRVPDSRPLSQILASTGTLAATSANISGQPSAVSAQQAAAALGLSVDLYLDAGPTPGPVASTVVQANSQAPDGIDILREGVISAALIHKLLAQHSQQSHSSDHFEK